MATMSNVAIEVTAPPVVPYRHGLFSVVPAAPPSDSHFAMMGDFVWESRWCGQNVGVTSSPCVQDNPAAITIDATSCDLMSYEPFWAYSYSQASAGAVLSAESEDVAREALAAGEEYAVESRLWGLLGPAVTEVAATGGPQALAYVEQLLAQTYKGQGVIHMGRYAAQLLSQYLFADGPILRTRVGTPVVAGGGYEQVGGALPATFNIYGTGPIVVVAGPASVMPAQVDRAVNDVHALAFKPFVVGWDCTAIGVTVTP